MWVKYRRYPIPPELFYDGYREDRDDRDNTILMLWVEHRRESPIPEYLFYNGCSFDRNDCDETALTLWSKYHPTEFAPWLVW